MCAFVDRILFILVIFVLFDEPLMFWVFILYFCSAGFIMKFLPNYLGPTLGLICSFLFLIFAWSNKDFGFMLLASGPILNMAVIINNDYRMPINSKMVKKFFSGPSYVVPAAYCSTNPRTRLAFLGDNIHIPHTDAIVSVGDILIDISLLLIYIKHYTL